MYAFIFIPKITYLKTLYKIDTVCYNNNVENRLISMKNG